MREGSENRGKRRTPKKANVIHVRFGPGGGRLGDERPTEQRVPPVEVPETPEAARYPGTASAREPIAETFTQSEVARLLAIPEGRLRGLDRAAIVSPSGTRKGRRAYTFQDLIALRVTRELLSQKVTLRDVGRAVEALRQLLPRVTRPLHELRIVSDGRRIVVRAEEGAFEPTTGQMVLDFSVQSLRADVVRVLRPEATPAHARTAYDLYVRANELDENPVSLAEAAALYQRAIDVDPSLSIAYTNLGNVRFRQGDETAAVALYRRAIEIDEGQPEAHYNLGYVMLERGEPRPAVGFFERAIAADPRFADAHFNIAMAYEQLGERRKARPYWQQYLELEPAGPWSDIAREHV